MSKRLTEQAGDGDDSGKRRHDLTREQMRFAEVLGEMLAEVREREQQLPEKPGLDDDVSGGRQATESNTAVRRICFQAAMT